MARTAVFRTLRTVAAAKSPVPVFGLRMACSVCCCLLYPPDPIIDSTLPSPVVSLRWYRPVVRYRPDREVGTIGNLDLAVG